MMFNFGKMPVYPKRSLRLRSSQNVGRSGGRYAQLRKITYIHENPVVAGLVNKAEDYPYSSAPNYFGGKGLLPVIILDGIYSDGGWKSGGWPTGGSSSGKWQTGGWNTTK